MNNTDSPSRNRRARSASPREGGEAAPEAEAFRDANRGQRLHRYLASRGIASRRACESMVLEGRVHVNGIPVTTLPAWVDPDRDWIEVDGQRLRPRRDGPRGAHCYVVLNKPRHVISTTHDPQGRRPVTDMVAVGRRLYPVGRLDADSTGLILLTDDGDLAHRLTHPRYEVPKVYHVSVRGRVTDENVQQLKKGLFLAPRAASQGGVPPRRASVAQVRLISRMRRKGREPRTRLAVTLREGQNRQIRRLVARLGHKVLRLERIALGPLRIQGLAVGQWRHLRPGEVASLRRAAGLAAPGRSSARGQTGLPP